MRTNPEFKEDDFQKLPFENQLQQRLAVIVVFAGVFGFLIKIIFL